MNERVDLDILVDRFQHNQIELLDKIVIAGKEQLAKQEKNQTSSERSSLTCY